MLLLSLIGEQPIPNLLPIRALGPCENLLVYTEYTRQVAARLRQLITPGADLSRDLFIPDPYDYQDVYRAILDVISSLKQVTINLTGGTKITSLAAYQAAAACICPTIYLKSESKESDLYRYEFLGGQLTLVDHRVLGTLVTIEDYLAAHGLKPIKEKWPTNAQEAGLRRWFERLVQVGLLEEVRAFVDFDAFEIDFIVQRGNQVAIIEVKDTREGKRKGIDQLNTAGGREHLGTYTGKILIVRKQLGHQLSRLAEARHVEVVVTDGQVDRRTGRLLLNRESEKRLLKTLDSVLGNPSNSRKSRKTQP